MLVAPGTDLVSLNAGVNKDTFVSIATGRNYSPRGGTRRVIFPALYVPTSSDSPQSKVTGPSCANPRTAEKSDMDLVQTEDISLQERLAPWNIEDTTPAVSSETNTKKQMARKHFFSRESHSPIMPLRPILRRSSYSVTEGSSKNEPDFRCKVSSVGSDIPSLASSNVSLEELFVVLPNKRDNGRLQRSVSDPTARTNIQFDPRILVREFQRGQTEQENLWYTHEDMETFKSEALQLVIKHTETQLLPTGTGRFVQKEVRTAKALYSHKALRWENESILEQRVVQEEIRNVLVVDPHDICLQLFAKGLQQMFPRANIFTASSSDEALLYAHKKIFDIVIVEERLKVFHRQNRNSTASGLALFRNMAEIMPRAIYIGVSASADRTSWNKSGVDLVWTKPPPTMDHELRREMVKALLIKRGNKALIHELYEN